MLQKVMGREATELPTNQKLLENLYEQAGKQLEESRAAGRYFLAAYDKFEADLGSRAVPRGEYRRAWFASTGESKPVWLGADDAAAKRIPEPRRLFTLDPEIGKYLEIEKVEALLNGLCDLQENALEWNLSRRARLLAARAVEGLISKVRELRGEIEHRLQRESEPHSHSQDESPKSRPVRQRSVPRTDAATESFVSALSKHHGYDNGRATRFEPVKSAAALARLARIGRRTCERRFKTHFGGMDGYRQACANPAVLSVRLAVLNREAINDTASRAILARFARESAKSGD